jgi:hypothetical protein
MLRKGRFSSWSRQSSINADDASGGAEIGSATHLELTEQVAIWLAGVVAQEVFNAPGHELGSFKDNVAIMELLEEHGISEQAEGPALRARAGEIAAAKLEANRTKVNDVVNQLVQRGRLEASEFRELIESK